MTAVVIGLIFVVLGTIAYVALRNAQDFSDANEVIPGRATRAPKGWAGAHSPEARLHRRLRDAMTSLRTASAMDDPGLLEVRVAIEQETLALDDRLVDVAALPARTRVEPMDEIARAVDSIEAAVADVVLLRGPSVHDVEAGIERVRARLALVREAQAELGGGSTEMDRLRTELEIARAAQADPAPTGEPAAPEPGAPATDPGPTGPDDGTQEPGGGT